MILLPKHLHRSETTCLRGASPAGSWRSFQSLSSHWTSSSLVGSNVSTAKGRKKGHSRADAPNGMPQKEIKEIPLRMGVFAGRHLGGKRPSRTLVPPYVRPKLQGATLWSALKRKQCPAQ